MQRKIEVPSVDALNFVIEDGEARWRFNEPLAEEEWQQAFADFTRHSYARVDNRVADIYTLCSRRIKMLEAVGDYDGCIKICEWALRDPKLSADKMLGATTCYLKAQFTIQSGKADDAYAYFLAEMRSISDKRKLRFMLVMGSNLIHFGAWYGRQMDEVRSSDPIPARETVFAREIYALCYPQRKLPPLLRETSEYHLTWEWWNCFLYPNNRQ